VDTTRRRRVRIVLLCALTVTLGSGILFVGGGVEITTFAVESDERAAADQLSESFDTGEQQITQVVITSDQNDTASTAALEETLTLQQAIRDDETINGTLDGPQPTVGVANGVAVASDPRIAFAEEITIADKASALDGRTDEQTAAALSVALRDDEMTPEGQPPVSALLPENYAHGEEPASAQLLIVVHDEDATDDELLDAQQQIESLADDRLERTDSFVFGEALLFERGGQATAESFAVVGPLIVLVVLTMLVVAYRDPLDVLLASVGIGVVLVWLAGILGWLGRPFNQLLIAVPCLLVGLGIDYYLHVVMRYRETRGDDPSFRPAAAMSIALAGVLVAIGTTTVTTAAGFLTGLVSPIEILREFGLVASLGIVSAFVVFGYLIPALRVEIDELLHQRERQSDRAPPTVGSLGIVARPLDQCARLVARAPLAVLVLAFLFTVGGAMGATAVDTSTERSDFFPEERSGWMEQLPAEIRPDAYGLREQATFLEETFPRHTDRTVEVWIEGDVTDDSVTQALQAAETNASAMDTTGTPVDGGGPVESPLGTIEDVAAENETVAELVDEHDTTGDGVPDEDLATVFDAVYEADRDAAAATINRTDGGAYEAVRLSVVVDESADDSAIRSDAVAITDAVETHPELTAVVTGEPILDDVQERAVLETVLLTFLLALAVIGALLTVVFRSRHRSWLLGAITVAPVVAAIAWLIGTMAALSLPYNAETALITAIAVGLGTDYTVHLTERFLAERERAGLRDALEVTLRETGGAVLASAITTAVGFGLLALTLVPSLQRFGIVTAIVVAYAFLASVLVLPSLLVVWDRTRRK